MIILRRKEFSTALSRGLAKFNKTILRKTPMEAKRSAIKGERKILTPIARGMNKIQHLNNSLQSTALNPGAAINRGVEITLRHPISTTTQIVGKATMAVDPTGIGLVPIGAVGTAGEVALRKYSPKYARITDRLGNKYRNSKNTKYIEGGINGVVNSIKSVM